GWRRRCPRRGHRRRSRSGPRSFGPARIPFCSIGLVTCSGRMMTRKRYAIACGSSVAGRLAECGGDIGGEAGQAVAAELTMPEVEGLEEPLLSHREADEVA